MHDVEYVKDVTWPMAIPLQLDSLLLRLSIGYEDASNSTSAGEVFGGPA